MKSLLRTAAILLVLMAGGSGFLLYRHVLLQRTGSLRVATLAPSGAAASSAGSSGATSSDAGAAAAAGSTSANSDEGDALEAAAPAHPVPSTLPDVSLPDLAGRQTSLQSFRGRPLILNFWATWCAPCRREIPLLQKLLGEHTVDHLEIVGIAVDSRSAVADYVKKNPIGYPLLIGEQQGLDVIQRFGMEAVLPFSVFVASNGQIVALKIGELHADEAEFILATLDRIGRGAETLPAARVDIAQALKTFATQRAKAQAVTG